MTNSREYQVYLYLAFVILQTLATVLTYWTFRKWIHSSSWLFIFWLLQLVAVVIEFRSVMMRVRTIYCLLHTSSYEHVPCKRLHGEILFVLVVSYLFWTYSYLYYKNFVLCIC